MKRTERIKAAIKVAFATGIVIGGIAGVGIGYHIGTGDIKLPEKTEKCIPHKCEHYTREVIGGKIVYEKFYCCGTHGHDCSSY